MSVAKVAKEFQATVAKEFQKVQVVVDALRAEISAKRQLQNDLYGELHALQAAAPDRESTARHLEETIDALAAVHSPTLRYNLNSYICELAARTECKSRLATTWVDQIRSDRLAESGLFALLAPALKLGIPSALAAMEWPEGAVSDADLERRTPELQTALATVEAELEALQAQADLLRLQ